VHESKLLRLVSLSAALVLASLFTACGGGGGGGSALPPPGNPGGCSRVESCPTPPPQQFVVSGVVTDSNKGAPLSGATITMGAVPNNTACNQAQTDILNVCGTPVAPTVSASSGENGAYSLNAGAAGTYMLTIAMSNYATLHRTVTVNVGLNTISGSLSHLSADEIAWLADINTSRATISYPHSFPNLQIDEYAERQARAWAADVAAGITQYGDPGYAKYGQAYSTSPGAMYAPAGVEAAIPPPGRQWKTADAQWFGEKVNCPSENWQTCTFASNTGHYILLSSTSDVWLGLGESATSFILGNFGPQFAYDAMIIEAPGAAPPSYIVMMHDR